ncbi:MAG: helix-turn-helix transcriptional regulator [Candidatus Omnitrophica bacterium]|nr:helix-turn-helix transcriptional regulator [Candidatus Omnitrophota bacterium]
MDTDIRLKLAGKLRELRKKRGLTQEKLSEASGIDYKHIQLLESKKAPAAKLDTIAKLAKAFHISPSELLKF